MQLMKEHQTRLERFKKWAEDHDRDLLFAGSVLIATGLVINYVMEVLA